MQIIKDSSQDWGNLELKRNKLGLSVVTIGIGCLIAGCESGDSIAAKLSQRNQYTEPKIGEVQKTVITANNTIVIQSSGKLYSIEFFDGSDLFSAKLRSTLDGGSFNEQIGEERFNRVYGYDLPASIQSTLGILPPGTRVKFPTKVGGEEIFSADGRGRIDVDAIEVIQSMNNEVKEIIQPSNEITPSINQKTKQVEEKIIKNNESESVEAASEQNAKSENGIYNYVLKALGAFSLLLVAARYVMRKIWSKLHQSAIFDAQEYLAEKKNLIDEINEKYIHFYNTTKSEQIGEKMEAVGASLNRLSSRYKELDEVMKRIQKGKERPKDPCKYMSDLWSVRCDFRITDPKEGISPLGPRRFVTADDLLRFIAKSFEEIEMLQTANQDRAHSEEKLESFTA